VGSLCAWARSGMVAIDSVHLFICLVGYQPLRLLDSRIGSRFHRHCACAGTCSGGHCAISASSAKTIWDVVGLWKFRSSADTLLKPRSQSLANRIPRLCAPVEICWLPSPARSLSRLFGGNTLLQHHQHHQHHQDHHRGLLHPHRLLLLITQHHREFVTQC
jgi:hypothetical protein